MFIVICRIFAISSCIVFCGPIFAQDQSDAISADASGTGISGSRTQFSDEGPTGSPNSAEILVLNQEWFLAQSIFGQRIQTELQDTLRALADENREIEASLIAEELRLTELRATLAPDEFQALAQDFDARVEAVRAAQQSKTRSLQAQADAAQARFFELAFPILLEVMRARDATVMMDSRSVLLSVGGIDVTEEVLAQIDAEIGDGGTDPLVRLDHPDITGQTDAPQPSPN